MRVEQPLRAVVIAGPNGSGKSTLTDQLHAGMALGFLFPAEYINADEIAKELRRLGDPAPERTAFDRARERRRQYREARISFAYETVLSHPSGLLDLQRLRSAGFEVTFIFVATADATINVERVARRAQAGGHDVPADTIRSRYERCLQFLPRAVEIAHISWIYDATDRHQLCLHAENGVLTSSVSVPHYLQSHLVSALRDRAAARRLLAGRLESAGQLLTLDEDQGVYEGVIVTSLLPYACLQRIGEAAFVCHDGSLLTSPVVEGERVTLRYNQGYATPNR